MTDQTIDEFMASFERLWAIYVTLDPEAQRALLVLMNATAPEQEGE